MRNFDDVCSRRSMKISADKSKVTVLNGEEELWCEVPVDKMRLGHVSEL